MLTSKERLRLTLAKKPVDRPPCICPGGMMNAAVEEVMDLSGNKWPEAHSNSELMAGLAAGIYEQGGFENFGVPFYDCGGGSNGGRGFFGDEGQ